MDRVRVSLRLFADDLDPDEVTRLLRRTPTRAERRGDELPGRCHMVARTGSWRLKSDRDEGDELEAQIAALLDSLPDDLAIWAWLRDLCAAGTMDLFCGLFLKEFNRGLDLSPGLLRRIGERHLRLSLESYGP